MKKIETNQETATAWSPFKVESKAFLQSASAENYEALIKSIVISNLGSYSSTVPYVVEGCVLSNLNKDISAGVVFYNGVFYNVSAITGGTAPLEFQLETTADGTADPTTFSDGSSHNIHLDYHFTTYSAGAAPTPSFSATDLVSLYGTAKITQNLQLATLSSSSTSYATITGLTYTTPNDGKTRTFMITGNTSFNFSTSTGNGAFLQIWNGSSELAVNENYLSIVAVNVDTAKLPISVCYVGSIAPNTTISLRVKMANSAASNYLNSSLVIVEI